MSDTREFKEYGRLVSKNKFEPVVIRVVDVVEGTTIRVPKFEPIYFEFPIVSERGSTIESERLRFKGTHMPLNGRTETKSRIAVRGDDTMTLKCYKDKGYTLYEYTVTVGMDIVLVKCVTVKNKRG